jgi:hypothetical protein
VPEVVEAREILGLDVRQAAPVEGDLLLDALDETAKTVELDRHDPLARLRLELGLEDHGVSTPPQDAIVTR